MPNLFETLAAVVDETDVEAMFADDYPFATDDEDEYARDWDTLYNGSV